MEGCSLELTDLKGNTVKPNEDRGGKLKIKWPKCSFKNFRKYKSSNILFLNSKERFFKRSDRFAWNKQILNVAVKIIYRL